MQIRLPWGAGSSLTVEVPSAWEIAGVHSPDLSQPVPDYRSALERALSEDCQIAGLRPGHRVAIVVDDGSRWTPVRETLSVLLPALHRRDLRPEDISISVAVGRHRALDDAALRRRLGEEVVSRYRCFSPPVDDASAYLDLGLTPERIPVRVFRPVAEADLRVLVGSVLPHLQAGFGGGWKLIFPGTSHRTTLGALHRQGLDGNMAELLGTDASENPMRRAVRSASRLLTAPTLSISHLMGPPGCVLQVLTGAPDEVQDVLAREACRRFQAPNLSPADVVIVNNHPWPGDPLQSFKTLIQHSAACRKGGVLVGFFWTDPDEIDRSAPLLPLRAISAAGGSGDWIVRRAVSATASLLKSFSAPSAFMTCWARELVVDRTVLLYSPPLRKSIGARLGPIHVFADEEELWRVAEHAIDARVIRPTVRVFPFGGLTYCPANSVKS